MSKAFVGLFVTCLVFGALKLQVCRALASGSRSFDGIDSGEYEEGFDYEEFEPPAPFEADLYGGPPPPLVPFAGLPGPAGLYGLPAPPPVYAEQAYPAQPYQLANSSSSYQQPVTSTETYVKPQQQQVYGSQGQSYEQQSYGQQQQAKTQYVKNSIISAPVSSYDKQVISQPQVTFYNKQVSSYALCPKNVFASAPSRKDIEAALVYASQQLNLIKGQSIQFMNLTSSKSQQFFNLIANKPNAKSDEEGLLIEFASKYISQRLCMSKWDKQRYLPSLTKILSNGNLYPASHSCRYPSAQSNNYQQCLASKYRTIDGFCNNPYHPYWGKSRVCHIRILSPDYADGISAPRESIYPHAPLPSPRLLSEIIHNDLYLPGPYNLMKMQWGQFINHDITLTAASSYEGLVDCCKNPNVPGCYPIFVPPNDRFYSRNNVTCLNFIRSAVCPVCELGPRQQLNENTAFLDLSQVYGSTPDQTVKLRAFAGGLLKANKLKTGELVLPTGNDKQCGSSCFVAGDNRVNQHPTLTALHVLALRRHNQIALNLAQRHPTWNDEYLFQEARRLAIAEYQMITYNEYLPIVFGPKLSAYYHIYPSQTNYTQYNPKTDPTTWNEYISASCRFGHSQISNLFSLLPKVLPDGTDYIQNSPANSFPIAEWFFRPSFIEQGLTGHLINGLVSRSAQAVDQWVVDGVRNHLNQQKNERHGGDLPATNVQRGRDHGIPGYIHYLEWCSKGLKIRSWRDLAPFFDRKTLAELRAVYKYVENIDLFTGGISELHAPGADTGFTFACINGIQYYHLKFGDRYYFEHANQAGSFTPIQLAEIKRSTLTRYLCKTSGVEALPAQAFLKVSPNNPLVNCQALADINYNLF